MTEIPWLFSPSTIETALAGVLGERRRSAEADETARLHSAMRFAVFGGGKRLRSLLLLESAWVVGGRDFDKEKAFFAACAIELIHSYSLVHDDLPAMDDAAMRRGRPSCHREFDEATAILAGDALLTLAFDIMANGVLRDKKIEVGDATARLRAIGLLARAAGEAGMVGGQMIDITWSDKHITDVSGPKLLQMHALKTGALIRAAAEIGAVIGGGSAGQIAAMRHYGACVGRAFQIHDDVLDVEGDPQLMGKDATDAANFKTTAVEVFGLEHAKQLAREASDEAISALNIFGDEANALRVLARFVVQREK